MRAEPRAGWQAGAKAHTALQARDKEFFWVGWEILEFRQKSTVFDPCVEELTLAAVWRGWAGSRQAEEEAGVLLRDEGSFQQV